MRGSVVAQANSSTLTDDNALGRILKIAEENRERIYKINGIDTIENIHKRILEHVGEKIGSSLG